MGKSLLTIDQLTNFDISMLTSMNYLDVVLNQDVTACLMFFQPSTRTRISFETACINEDISYIIFDQNTSSIQKGENIFDTVNTLYSMGIKIFIIRSSDNIIFDLYRYFKDIDDIHFINAGSGTEHHPTQALLDYATMKKYKPEVITIVGDIYNSRVAKSNITLLSKLDKQIRLLPYNPELVKDLESDNVTIFDNYRDALLYTDIVMCLRPQVSEVDSHKLYITNFLVRKFCPDAKIMHPGPVKYKTISKELAFSKNSLISDQVSNGVNIRRCLLKWVLE